MDLLNQYFFLQKILESDLEPRIPKMSEGFHDLSIKVEKIDCKLLFRQAQNAGLGQDNSFTVNLETFISSGLIAKKGEYLFALGENNLILNRLDWPKDDAERNRMGEIYAQAVFYTQRDEHGHYSGQIHDQVKFLVWITIHEWHKDTFMENDRFGQYGHTDVQLTVYKTPDCGIRALHGELDFADHLTLNIGVLMRAAVRHDNQITTLSGRLEELCRLFEDDVYQNGMKELFEAGEHEGASGQFGSIAILCHQASGMLSIRLQDPYCDISLRQYSTQKHMSVRAMNGTLTELRRLIKLMVKMWNEQPECRSSLKTDKEILGI